MITRGTRRTALSGLAALALAASAVGPCHCLANVNACHPTAQEVDAHACCQKPTGVQAVADQCCGDDAPELLLASTDVPEVAAPMLQGGHAAMAEVPARAVPADPIDAPPPHPPDRTTVLLI